MPIRYILNSRVKKIAQKCIEVSGFYLWNGVRWSWTNRHSSTIKYLLISTEDCWAKLSEASFPIKFAAKLRAEVSWIFYFNYTDTEIDRITCTSRWQRGFLLSSRNQCIRHCLYNWILSDFSSQLSRIRHHHRNHSEDRMINIVRPFSPSPSPS